MRFFSDPDLFALALAKVIQLFSHPPLLPAQRHPKRFSRIGTGTPEKRRVLLFIPPLFEADLILLVVQIEKLTTEPSQPTKFHSYFSCLTLTKSLRFLLPFQR